MEYVIDGDRLVATVPDGEGFAIAAHGQVVASQEYMADWASDYRTARREISDALVEIRFTAAVRDLPSAGEAERVLGQLLSEIDARLAG